jgi:endonuclease/exonuclease/phosphatase family metal-dependent hydrolase
MENSADCSKVHQRSITDPIPDALKAELCKLMKALDLQVPPKTLDRNLLVATWNIRAFGRFTQKWISEEGDSPKRDMFSMRCIAEIVKRFDVLAVQEVKGNLKALRHLMKALGPDWGFLLTDITKGDKGNGERLAFIYDKRRVGPSGLAGEIVVPEVPQVKTQGNDPAVGVPLVGTLDKNDTEPAQIQQVETQGNDAFGKAFGLLGDGVDHDLVSGLDQSREVPQVKTQGNDPSVGVPLVGTLDKNDSDKPGEAGQSSGQSQFARTPYAVSFTTGTQTFILVTMHVIYGNRLSERAEELRTIAKWLADWAKSEHVFHHNLIILGDFNIDRKGDRRYDAFTSTGLHVPQELHDAPRTVRGCGDESKRKFYDQIAWFKDSDDLSCLSMECQGAGGFDFVGVGLGCIEEKDLAWKISDHVPLWVEFAL